MTDQTGPDSGNPATPGPSEAMLRECARALFDATGIRVLNNHNTPATAPPPATGQAAPADRAALSAKLWEIAEHHIVAEWICCEPLDPKHDLCAKGYAALGMAKTLLVDSPEAWNPNAPLLDAILAELPAPADTGRDDSESEGVVAYRSPGTRQLYCVTCARQETGWQPVTEARGDAVCDFCGGQVHAIASQTLGSVIARHADAEQAEDPARIDRLRPEFTEHASVESIDTQLQRARSQERRWHLRVEWLISLRQARVTQKARGEWPAAAQQSQDADGDRIVAYRSALPGALSVYCTRHTDELGDGVIPLTSDDLPDGGLCAGCGVDVLIPQHPKEA